MTNKDNKSNKKQRHNAIISIINENSVETQGQLTQHLLAEGYDVTQATVSRDIKELHLIKLADINGKYCYALPDKDNDASIRSRYNAVLTHAMITVQNAMNMVIVKTIPGSAQGCAMAIETLELNDIVGILAGDDTVFIATNSVDEAEALVKLLTETVN